MSEKFRSRLFVAVLYPEDPAHVECMEKLNKNGYNFAAILHDKDVYEDGEHEGETKKAHWHIIVRFKNAVWNTAVAKELGIEPNYLEACKDGDSALLYLVHYGKEEKFQYEYEAVFGDNLASLQAELLELQRYGEEQLSDLSCRELEALRNLFSELITQFGDIKRELKRR